MNTGTNSNEILSRIKLLNKSEQIALFEKVASLIRKSEIVNPSKLSDLSGLGSSIWHATDIDKYINDEREW